MRRGQTFNHDDFALRLPANLFLHYNARPSSARLIAMPLDSARKKHLRTIGHQLRPIVMVSERGISEGISLELERALEDHELIKVKLAVAEPAARRELATAICEQHRAELVQAVGKVILLFRAAQKPNPRLSNLLRQP
jgi:RNA-binding protein